MKAFAIAGYGRDIALRNLPEPKARPGEVIVDIAAASVNPLDLKIRRGELKAILKFRFPVVLGHDLAGTVSSVGAGVTHFKAGDEVFGCTSNRQMGTFAERVAIDAADLALKPKSLSFIEAAAMPLVTLTAWQVLVERARARPGSKVFIEAGSGGAGSMAVQLAKHLGAFVATTAGPQNLQFAKSLGADQVINYHAEDFGELLSGFDIALHSQGEAELRKALGILKRGGQLVSLAGPPDPAFGKAIGANAAVRAVLWLTSRGVRRAAKSNGTDYSFLFMQPSGAQLTKIAALVEAGALRPVIDETFPFAETPAALAKLAGGRARGKIVIEISSVAASSPMAG